MQINKKLILFCLNMSIQMSFINILDAKYSQEKHHMLEKTQANKKNDKKHYKHQKKKQNKTIKDEVVIQERGAILLITPNSHKSALQLKGLSMGHDGKGHQ